MVRYQGGEAAAIEELVRRLSPTLSRYLLFSQLSAAEAEDLLQDCWLRIHRSRHTYRPPEPVLPWIFAIARHTRLDGYRRGRRRAAFLLGLVSFFPWRAPEAFLSRGWHCLKMGLMLSASAAFVFWLFTRRGAVLRLHMMGAILGTCGGFVGVTALQVACNHQDLGHLVVWHGAVLVTSIAVGVGVTGVLQRAIRPV